MYIVGVSFLLVITKETHTHHIHIVYSEMVSVVNFICDEIKLGHSAHQPYM